MDVGSPDLPELKQLPLNILRARLDRGFSQSTLAKRGGMTQAQISLFEAGRRRPSLDQFVRLARALDVPLQSLLTGNARPGADLKDIALELRLLGASDLWVADSTVPGAARRPEEVLALAVWGSSPDPRVVETIPALLSWNSLNPHLLRAYGVTTRTIYRLGWLADIALTIDRQREFPGGCRREPLERFLKAVKLPSRPEWDNLGRGADAPQNYPVWKRWKISYAATLEQFERRAHHLKDSQPFGFAKTTRESSGRLSVRRAVRGRPRTNGGASSGDGLGVHPEQRDPVDEKSELSSEGPDHGF